MREEREIIKLTKILIVLVIFMIIMEFMSCRARAAEITGETHLLGGAYWIEKYTEAEGHQPYTEDIELLAEVIFHENWHTDPEHLAAYYTGAVVMNRVNSPRWPDTIRKVLYQKGQYSTTGKFFTKTLPDECYEMAAKILKNGTPDVPENVVFQAMFKQGHGVWRKVNTDYFCYE
jgi:hypothetical protein